MNRSDIVDRTEFIQASSTTRVYEKSLLHRAQLDRMIEADDIDGVYRVLNETKYSERIAKLEDKYDIDSFLDGEINYAFGEMYQLTKYKELIDILALPYSYHNIKVVVKESILNSNLEKLYCKLNRSFSDELRMTLSRGDEIKATDEYRKAVVLGLEEFEKTNDPQRTDLVIDRCYFEHLNKLAKRCNVDLVLKYAEDSIDFYNIKFVLRAKSQNKPLDFVDEFLVEGGNVKTDDLKLNYFDSIENIILKLKSYEISTYLLKGLTAYEKTGKLSEFERGMENHQMDLAKESKKITYGPEVLFSYIIAKEAEIESIRVIFTAKINDLPPEEIRTRLRDLYV